MRHRDRHLARHLLPVVERACVQELVALLDDLHECSPSSFKRLHEGLNLKAFKTSEGFISLKAGISLVGLDAKSLPVDPPYLFAEAARLLPEAYSSGRVSAVRLPLPQ